MNMPSRFFLFSALLAFALHAEADQNLENAQETVADSIDAQTFDFDFNSDAPIFNAFPGLQETLPHITLGTFPTPILKADKFGIFLKEAFGFDAKNIYIKQDFHLGFILYAIECNTINPTYAIAEKNYDSSKDNTILGLQIFSYICAFLSYISLLYYVYANFTKLNRLYERIPIPQAEQLNPTRT